jgi:hypothetical protein
LIGLIARRLTSSEKALIASIIAEHTQLAEVEGRLARRARDYAAAVFGHSTAERQRDALLRLLVRVNDDYEYQTPAGTTNCRHCDINMDDLGTGDDMHAANCVIREITAAIADAKGKTKTGSIREALRESHEAGGNAWEKAADPEALMCEIRGGDGLDFAEVSGQRNALRAACEDVMRFLKHIANGARIEPLDAESKVNRLAAAIQGRDMEDWSV